MERLWRCNSLLIYTSFLVFVLWHFRIGRFFPFLVIVTWNFHKWNFFPSLVCLCKNVKVPCFSASFVQKTPGQSDGSCNVTSDSSFYTKYSKNNPFFISANTYEKYIVSGENCIAHYDDKMWFLPNCINHNILKGDIKELLRKWLHSLLTTTNTWIVCIHISSTDSLEKFLSR